MNLFQIDNSIEELHKQIEASVNPETGEVDEEAVSQLIQAQAQVPEKINNIIAYIRYCERMADVAKQYENDYKQKKQQIENRKNNMRKYLTEYMVSHDTQKIDTGLNKLSLRSSKSLSIDSVEDIPDSLKMTEIVTKPDTAQIKHLLMQGEKINGASLIESTSITIR